MSFANSAAAFGVPIALATALSLANTPCKVKGEGTVTIRIPDFFRVSSAVAGLVVLSIRIRSGF